MKIGLISDIHSNIYGLTATIKELKSCDVILCAGDITGYYTFVNEVFEVLENHEVIFVRGNHDELLLQESFEGLPPLLIHSIEYTKSKITKNNLEKLEKTPVLYKGVLDGIKLILHHRNNEVLHSNIDLVVHGHSHIPSVKHDNGIIIVDPGSCGQPRDGDPRASYGVFHTNEKKAIIGRVKYDIDKVIEAGRRACIHPKFIEILNRKKP